MNASQQKIFLGDRPRNLNHNAQVDCCVRAAALLALSALWCGCVSPKPPDMVPYDYDAKVPLVAVFHMERSAQEAVSSRGAVKIPIGRFVHRYAIACFTNGFSRFTESATAPPSSEYDVLITINDIKHKLDVPFPSSTFVLDLEAAVQVDNREGKRLVDEILKDKVTVPQSPSAGILATFELSSRLETALHRSLAKHFRELMETIQDESKNWRLPTNTSATPQQ